MQIYSTLFPIMESLTQDKFIEMVIEWNQESPHNRINNLQWNGSRNVRFEENNLLLCIEELKPRNIVATRFRQVDSNGIIWTTDFVANFDDKILTIRLDRETTQETTRFTPTFKPPILVNMIIERGYANCDRDLEIVSEPIIINKNNYNIIEKIILKREKYILPVVYVTKTWTGRYPLDVKQLAYRLRGIAHVLKEVDPNVSYLLKANCNGKNVHHGAIGIYYPNFSVISKKINTTRYAGYESDLEDKIVNTVCRYMNQQARDRMYTWEGVQNELLRLKNDALLVKSNEAESEKDDLYDTFNDLIKEQTETIEVLNSRIMALEQENQGLHTKLDGMDEIPLIIMGEEDELYEGEIREILLDIMNEQLKSVKKNSRREHILRDIIDNNKFDCIPEKRRNRIKKILKGYTKVNDTLLQELKDFGFAVTSEKKHYKLVYYNDHRYMVTMSKTGSDGMHGGGNLASEITRNML